MDTLLTAPFPALTLSDAEFEKWRYVQDAPADAVARALINSPHWHEAYIALSTIQKNSDKVNIEIFRTATDTDTDDEHVKLVKLLNDYFDDISLLTFTDEQKRIIRKGCTMFGDYANDCVLILAVRSLLKQYAAFKATNVLVGTKLIAKYPHRRILETFQFVVDVMDLNGFEPDGKAIRSIQKLRLVHAMIRARFERTRADPRYKDDAILNNWSEDWGLPINQQDMIFAIHTFSVEVIDGLLAEGEKLTDEEIENYYLTWHYYAKALGVMDYLNPSNYKDGKALQERIYKQQFTKDNPNAAVLTRPLLNFVKQLVPFHPRDEHIYAIIKLYNDKKDYVPVFQDILKIPLHEAHEHFLKALRRIERIWRAILHFFYLFSASHKKQSFDEALAMKEHNILKAILTVEDTWSNTSFQIPDGFGDFASMADEAKEKKEPGLFIRLLHKLFPRLAS